MKVLLRIKHDKMEAMEKILNDFITTSKNKGEPLEAKIDAAKDNLIEISGCKDIKHGTRIKYWFMNKFKDAVIYGMVEK